MLPGLWESLPFCPWVGLGWRVCHPVLSFPGPPPQLQQALAQLDEEEPCFEFRQQQLTVHRVHITFLSHQPLPPRPHDVTLVAQLSMDR